MPFSFDESSVAAMLGSVGTASLTVEAADTAIALGSGDVPVLATPRMIALMEQAAREALTGYLPADCTSVGAELAVRHVRPSAVGAQVMAEAVITAVEGALVSFSLVARDRQVADPERSLIGSGMHVRAAVQRDAFMRRLG